MEFDGRSAEDQRKLQAMTTGIVSFAYSTTLMRHEQHWQLDLTVPIDNAIAHKLLERLFATRSLSNSDSSRTLKGVDFTSKDNEESWTNTTLDGLEFELNDWAIDFGKITGSILGVADQDGVNAVGNTNALHQEGKTHVVPVHTSAHNTWRVPTSGLLAFDSISSHPKVLVCSAHSFDLSVPKEVVDLRDLWTRACSHKGQTLWNSRMEGKENGRPIQLPETLLLHSEGELELMRILPRHGILSFDFISLNYHGSSRFMQRYCFMFSFFKEPEQHDAGPADSARTSDARDNSSAGDTSGDTMRTDCNISMNPRHRQGIEHREKACAVFERTRKSPGSFEFCLNLLVDGEHIPQKVKGIVLCMLCSPVVVKTIGIFVLFLAWFWHCNHCSLLSSKSLTLCVLLFSLFFRKYRLLQYHLVDRHLYLKLPLTLNTNQYPTPRFYPLLKTLRNNPPQHKEKHFYSAYWTKQKMTMIGNQKTIQVTTIRKRPRNTSTANTPSTPSTATNTAASLKKIPN